MSFILDLMNGERMVLSVLLPACMTPMTRIKAVIDTSYLEGFVLIIQYNT